MIIVKGRELLIPENERYLGTNYDTGMENRVFRIPRLSQSGTDLSDLKFNVNLVVNGEPLDIAELQKNVDDDYIYLTWIVTVAQVAVTGTVFVCVTGNDTNDTVKWSSFMAPFYTEKSLGEDVETEFKKAIAKVNQEIEDRKTAVEALQSSLGSEAASRATEDVAINARIDNLILSAGGDDITEVVDARTGTDGIIYNTLKDRLDTENTDMIDELSVNPIVFPITLKNYNTNGVTMTYKGMGVYHIQGTATTSSFINFINTTGKGLPSTFKAGRRLAYKFDSNVDVDTNNFSFSIYSTSSVSAAGGWSILGRRGIQGPDLKYDITLPADSQGVLCRFNYVSGYTYNMDITFYILNMPPLSPAFNIEGKINGLGQGEAGPVDLNTVNETGWWSLFDAQTYLNKPTDLGSVGFLCNVQTAGWRYQIMFNWGATKMWLRRGNSSGDSWTEWNELSGGGGGGDTYNVTNNYDFYEYDQSVTLNAMPSITSDTNNYLASTGNTADRTADILSMLTASGTCHLGPGVFYINGLQMPDDSMIIGSGPRTKIQMSGTSDGFAINMGSRCLLKDFCLTGADDVPIFDDSIGGRHGILWHGTYTYDGSAPLMGMISDVYISNFTGGGITCYDTGYGTTTAIEGTNLYITNCWAGLNISYWSEFHKFTNVRCAGCRIGCVNNGGNNIFVNCDFSSSEEIGMLMDNSQGQSPNHTHGSCIGCVFNHTRHAGTANSGTGIEMLNCGGSGFIFEGCQIFFSKINLVDCDGIVFSNCNFGNVNCDISVSGGGTVLFSGNMHQARPSITISNNQNVHFVNCYVKSTGAIVVP